VKTDLRQLAALAIVALVGTGCSNAPADTGASGNPTATDRGKAVRFAECMRDNDVRESRTRRIGPAHDRPDSERLVARTNTPGAQPPSPRAGTCNQRVQCLRARVGCP